MRRGKCRLEREGGSRQRRDIAGLPHGNFANGRLFTAGGRNWDAVVVVVFVVVAVVVDVVAADGNSLTPPPDCTLEKFLPGIQFLSYISDIHQYSPPNVCPNASLKVLYKGWSVN